MRNYTYDFELETMLKMFIAALDDVIVKRYNKNKEVQDQIQVRFVYAPKQRVLLDIIDKAQNITLPVIAITNGGITRNPERVFNKIAGSHFYNSDPRYSNVLLQPIPIDITINMSILTKYQQDYDQIITNIIPYFDPYIEISWRLPDITDYEIRSKVVWSGSVTTEYPTDINAGQLAQIQGSTSFTFQGWLFKARPKADGNIFTIQTDFSLLPELTTLESLSSVNQNELTTERFILSGQPQPHVIEPYYTNVSASDTFTLYGKSFKNITAVYLSGNKNFNTTFYNPFSSTSLSSTYTGFYGYQLLSSSYVSDNDTVLFFTMPSSSKAGKVNVILQNPAGYGSLTQYASYITFNPWPSGSNNYNKWVPYKPPYLSGIEVYQSN